MKTSLPRKLGANRNSVGRKNKKSAPNFSQSRDVREDRGTRQQKFAQQRHMGLVQLAEPPRRALLLDPEHTTDGKRSVVIALNYANANTVTVAGTFNDWHPQSTPLRRVQPDEWRIELFLEPGPYQYRFVIDGKWADDPKATSRAPNGFGEENCLLVVT